jgi:hypothetical protein
LGEKLRSSYSVSLISKHFQKYYQKAREGRSVQLDDDLLAESVAAMRLSFSFTAEEAVAVLPMKVSAEVADSVKDISKRVSFGRGFLTRAWL